MKTALYALEVCPPGALLNFTSESVSTLRVLFTVRFPLQVKLPPEIVKSLFTVRFLLQIRLPEEFIVMLFA